MTERDCVDIAVLQFHPAGALVEGFPTFFGAFVYNLQFTGLNLLQRVGSPQSKNGHASVVVSKNLPKKEIQHFYNTHLCTLTILLI